MIDYYDIQYRGSSCPVYFRDFPPCAVFRLLFREQIEQHEQMISKSTIDELGAMLVEECGNNVKWARIELKKRYKEASPDDQVKIISYFKKGTTKQDVKWGIAHEKMI